MEFGNESVAKSFAYDDEDKFFDKHWTVHAGTWASGFANGTLVGTFDGWGKGKLETLQYGKEKLSGIEFGVRSIGVVTEFGIGSLAKYGKIKWNGFAGKAGKSSVKNVGYLLISYYK